MKKQVLLFLACLVIFSAGSQTVFCPPGAEWSYNSTFWYGGAPLPRPVFLEKAKYVRDSLLGTELVKVLIHDRFYLQCNGGPKVITLLKTGGDTVYMRNNFTAHNWEILYNFGALPGETWETTVRKDYGSSSFFTYTVTVDSVRSIQENGFTLKRLSVTYEREGNWNNLKYGAVLIERYGGTYFLYNFYNTTLGSCDADELTYMLCYKDDQFGTKQFTQYACDYRNPVGIKEQRASAQNIKISPNPASDKVTLAQDLQSPFPFEIEVIDLTGKSILKQSSDGDSSINTSVLNNGLYFMNISQQGKFFKTEKLVIIK